MPILIGLHRGLSILKVVLVMTKDDFSHYMFFQKCKRNWAGDSITELTLLDIQHHI